MLSGLMGLEVVFMELIVFDKLKYLSSKQYSIKDFDPLKTKVKVKIEEK